MVASRRTAVACGVDVGSTNTKVVVIDAEGGVVARVTRPTPRDGETLMIDALGLVDAIEQMIVFACGDLHEVAALCVAGVGEDGVLVDGDLAPLTHALAWFDPRRQSVFRALRPQLADDAAFDAETDAARSLVGWSWARAQQSEGAAHWLALTDLAAARWSGRPFMSGTLASRTAAWSSAAAAWSPERVELALGDPRMLPDVVPTGTVLGGVDAPALAAAGVLAPDAITVAGGHDHPIAGWGVDLISPGVVLDSMGTAEVVVAQSRMRPAARPDGIEIAPGILLEGTTLLAVEELARNVQWASQDPAVAHHIGALIIGRAQPEPVLESGYFVPGRRGGGQPAYALDAPRDALARASAVLGALALVGRDAVDSVRAAGAELGDVRLAGGWARSPGWIDIKAAVNGYFAAPILEPQVTAVGAALLAARARGWAPDPVRALAGFTASMLG